MEKSYNISKLKVEVYKFREQNGLGWADITIDALNNTGRISIASDFGDWQYFWGSCGMPFKEFLLKINKGYVAGKFGADKFFDLDKTIRNFKFHVIDNRKNDFLTQQSAREIFDEILGLQKRCGPHREELYHLIVEKEKLMSFFEGTPDFCNSIDPGFNRFWNEIWPILLNKFKEELSHATESTK